MFLIAITQFKDSQNLDELNTNLHLNKSFKNIIADIEEHLADINNQTNRPNKEVATLSTNPFNIRIIKQHQSISLNDRQRIISNTFDNHSTTISAMYQIKYQTV
ncbi:hypothetical protein CDIK_4215 [Cucumispora dikerogammari]|nr:hypothetical protein CDIK_4215 [Cucumispora dikerogammari]